MKLFNKIHDFFYDTPEEPIKEKQKESTELLDDVAEPSKNETIISERELVETKTDFKFPVVFDDEDFETEEKTRRSIKTPIEDNNRGRGFFNKEKKPEEKKFKPTPIISPVYGVLDKNYKAGEIDKPNSPYEQEKTKELNIDSVRDKAFGTLADDLEKTMVPQEDNMFYNLEEDSSNIVVTDETTEFDILENMNEPEEKISLTNYDFSEILDTTREERKKEELPEKKKNVSNDDLFNLIDSMYNKEG